VHLKIHVKNYYFNNLLLASWFGNLSSKIKIKIAIIAAAASYGIQ